MAKDITQQDINAAIASEVEEQETGTNGSVEVAAYDPALLLIHAVKANNDLIKQAKTEIQQSRESFRVRTVWKDFLKKYFHIS